MTLVNQFVVPEDLMRKMRGLNVLLSSAVASAAFAAAAGAADVRSHPNDFEARFGDQPGPTTPPPGYDPTTPTPTEVRFGGTTGNSVTNTRLRVGFERQYGQTDPQPDPGPQPVPSGMGGITAVWYFPLPVLRPGRVLETANFSTALLSESDDYRCCDITPRFNADLYGLGFTRTPT